MADLHTMLNGAFQPSGREKWTLFDGATEVVATPLFLAQDFLDKTWTSSSVFASVSNLSESEGSFSTFRVVFKAFFGQFFFGALV